MHRPEPGFYDPSPDVGMTRTDQIGQGYVQAFRFTIVCAGVGIGTSLTLRGLEGLGGVVQQAAESTRFPVEILSTFSTAVGALVTFGAKANFEAAISEEQNYATD